ncbi:hypothetical protein DPX16_14050 [Anabarilius grahami]|uniref:Uncharacterized protein n=1 Tax=Anabarilius grahami TaxID=495550 RepID=A0A3N0Y8T9_ANAGA|nr:hypothetical protein DPX16_14050 [Anabarilius grahami]
MDNEMGYLPFPMGTRPRKASRCGSISLPASARERRIMCATAPVAQNEEKGDKEEEKRRKIQIRKWSLALQTDRKSCLTDDGCSGRGVAAVIKQFTAPDAQLGDTCWTSLCAAHKPPESGSTEREGNRQTEGEEK